MASVDSDFTDVNKNVLIFGGQVEYDEGYNPTARIGSDTWEFVAGCPTGHAGPSCTACSKGWYKDTLTSTPCVQCPTGTTTGAEGATDIGSCILCADDSHPNGVCTVNPQDFNLTWRCFDAGGPTCDIVCPGVDGTGLSCSGHGTCSTGIRGTGACTCDQHWFGLDCAGQCNCGDGGHCADGANGTGTCSCDQGYFGTACADKCQCDRRHGRCSEGVSGDGSCTCDFLYMHLFGFDHCQLPILLFLLLTIGAVLGGVLACWIRRWCRRQEAERKQRIADMELERQRDLEELAVNLTNPLEMAHFISPPEEVKLLERLGAGGTGIVYKATFLGAPVAAKEVVGANVCAMMSAEFEHEARMLTQINHPYVLHVYGFVTKFNPDLPFGNQTRRYIVTDFAPNGSLMSVINKAATPGPNAVPFTKVQALEWATQIADGINVLHRRGFIHRDIKPDNILLSKNWTAVVADLGTVRLEAHFQQSVRKLGSFSSLTSKKSWQQIRDSQSRAQTGLASKGTTEGKDANESKKAKEGEGGDEGKDGGASGVVENEGTDTEVWVSERPTREYSAGADSPVPLELMTRGQGVRPQ